MAVSKFGVLITLIFCTALIAAAFLNLLPVEVVYLYITISTITFATVSYTHLTLPTTPYV